MLEKKILIVDDEPDFLKALQIILESNGFEVLTASDGQEGLSVARGEKPDLIILDLMLPKLDGYRVCRLLKFDEKYKDIPIIVLSARSQEQDKVLAKEVGADVYIVKSEQPEKLLERINQLLKEYENKKRG